MQNIKSPQTASAKTRLIVAISAGIIVAFLVSLFGSWRFAPIGAWDTAAVIYVVWVWFNIWPMEASETKSLAKREDPGRAVADVLLIVASTASLIAVGFLVTEASSSTGLIKVLDIALGMVSVVVSWAVVHTNYTLKYARLFYGDPEGGINFNENSLPQYKDFAYLAFTLGMTFQVSDTALQTKEIRTTALKHALLSYLFGTIIIATTINTIASLAK